MNTSAASMRTFPIPLRITARNFRFHLRLPNGDSAVWARLLYLPCDLFLSSLRHTHKVWKKEKAA
jgi:hypothetical protein